MFTTNIGVNMDRTITASEANQQFSRLLRNVAKGQTFLVMSRGRPVARVGPVAEAPTVQPIPQLLDYLETLPRRDGGAWTREDLYA